MNYNVLKERLEYDPETGLFKRKGYIHYKSTSDWFMGSLDNLGYLRLKIKSKVYKCHRLAWFYMTGAWPLKEIDHIDGDKTNNRFSNLRDVDRSSNLLNQEKPRKDGKNPYRGITWNRREKKWRASLTVKGILYRLGSHTSAEVARDIYLSKKKELCEQN